MSNVIKVKEIEKNIALITRKIDKTKVGANRQSSLYEKLTNKR